MLIRIRLTRISSLAFLFCAAAVATGEPATALFNGKDLTGWKTVGGKGTNQWTIGSVRLSATDPSRLEVNNAGTALISPVPGANLVTEKSFGDCILKVEFMMPRHSNSGVKLMGIYEIQLLDSFGKPVPDKTDCGAVYQESAPKVNACKAPGEWQTLEIHFRAPRFDESGKKVANAKFFKVILNGTSIHEDLEIAHGTNVSRNAPERPEAPILLQGDHGPVAFRNFTIAPLK